MVNNISLLINIIARYWFDFIITEVIFTTILFIIILPITYVLKNKSPYWKFGLWSLLFIRLILPSNFNLPGNIWQYLDNSYILSWINFDPVSTHLPTVEDDLSIFSPGKSDRMNLSINGFQDSGNNNFLVSIFFTAWLIGISGFFIIFYRKKQHYRNIIWNSRQTSNDLISAICQNWKDKYQLKRKITVFVSDKYLSPFTIGIIQSKIFIPQAVVDTNNQTMLKAVIGHELAHVKRYDALWTQLQYLIQAFFFFFPIVWFAGKHLNIAREGICDQMVLRHKQILPKLYAQSIIKILQLNSFGSINWPYAPALEGNKSSIKLRINQILENNIMNKKQIIVLILSLTLFGFTTLPMASILGESNVQGSQQPASLNRSADNIDFLSPMKTGRISSGFGNRIHPIKKVLMHHNGVDIAAPKGTEVYAIVDGIVDFAEFKDDWGNKIVLLHEDNFSSIYGQLSEILIKKGMQIKAGQLIGLVGNLGQSTAAHLHFEIRENNEPLNPEELIDFSKLKTVNK